MSKLKPPSVTCPTCKGAGETTLSSKLSKAYVALRQIRGGFAKDVLKHLKARVTVGAISNRLEDLRRLKLVSRQRIGKAFRYTANKEKENGC